jgi:hypothetical protein
VATQRPSAENKQDSQKKNNSLRDFQGINTQAYRTVIGDNQFAWLENVMPIGFGNMIVPPGPGVSIASWPATAYHMRAVNLSGVGYEIVFTTNGAIYAVNLTSHVVTAVAVAGTLSGSGSDVCQWENTTAVIVDPSKGYFTWDGATFKKWNGTIQSLTITAIGLGYTTVPAIGGFASGGGAGGAATCHIQVGLATLTAGGAGYVVGDVLTMVGGTFTTAAQIKVSSVAAGVINGFNLITTGDYTIAPANPAATTGGYGAAATFTLNFGIGPITLTASGAGYTSAPTITVTGGGGTAGAVTANLAAVPGGGTAVATYAGRVWVASGRTIAFSAPTSVSDFTQAAAGGSFVMVDETLVGNIITLRSANNFLYIVGESSVNVVADVAVVNGITVFSNTNISAVVGTGYANSVAAYYRSMWLANPYGIYALYGATTQKMSDDLDGIFPFITTDVELTAGTAVIGEVLCLCYLAKYSNPADINPIVGQKRSILLIFFNKKWWIASPRSDLVNIDTAIVGGQAVLYATEGTNLYKLFSDTTSDSAQTIVTKLWDMGDPLRDKETLKLGIEFVNPGVPQQLIGTIDTENPANYYQWSLSGGNLVQWMNNSGAIVSWINNSAFVVNWMSSGYTFQAIDVETSGKYIGITVRGVSAGTIYNAAHLQYEQRASW